MPPSAKRTGACTCGQQPRSRLPFKPDGGNVCLQTAPMFERNYACDRWIYSYFRLIDLNECGADALQRQLYFCMFGQALYMKAQVEGWRSNNIWGLLTWQ